MNFNNATEFVKRNFEEYPQHKLEFTYREKFSHTLRVLMWAEKLLETERADSDILLMAVIFHDVGYVVSSQNHMCSCELEQPLTDDSRIITSDDVFDFILNLRNINDGIDRKREELFEDYLETKYSSFRMNSLEDYEQLKKVNMTRSKTQSRYVRKQLMGNVREHSNGESAFLYFSEKIKENGLYLLDEPENSLSPEKQQELVRFLEDSARFYGCQFLIATHSPFLLSIRNAKIYDMDEEPVDVKRWTQLGNVRAYYDFFKKHEGEFY